MNAVKHILDKMGWSGWLVIERSRNKDEVRNVKNHRHMMREDSLFRQV